jgi:hypothetical protein
MTMTETPKPKRSRPPKPAKAKAKSRKPIVRGTTYTPQIGDEICARIAACESLAKICAEPDMPSQRTVMTWQRENEEFRLNLKMAREHRADARSDAIDNLIRQVEQGELDPHAGRVAIDAHKWLAARENPGRYGDRLVSEHVIHTGPSMEPATETTRWIERMLVISNEPPADAPSNVVALPLLPAREAGE